MRRKNMWEEKTGQVRDQNRTGSHLRSAGVAVGKIREYRYRTQHVTCQWNVWESIILLFFYLGVHCYFGVA
ncbi:hypothetical protein Pcinc_037687 [Petrolisthes cinctipes]|uniref:Uncharacterized protein n=1 Tax=Petrolisthes cinctipes TaxID=88211 RepID=A0AAE1BTJ0_PETCI|nr:hypothetical protein Pcinc_037687 [Petrolisthes cinctipes]